ncbi:MAG TPA: thioredoxin domain-containing protein [Acidocella sp.]|nr:thioredoxin domain-containing protein [Acidocella sp.]
MRLYRRSVLSLVGASVIAPSAFAAEAAPLPFTQRSIGSPKAPVTAVEYFSLTCTHCAHFATTVMPEVKAKLVDAGKLQVIFKDFPLDQVALMAAQVARYLPTEQYYPFIEALFSSQDQWAFLPVTDPKNPPDYAALIFQYAALAGMDKPTFDAAIHDDKLRAFILRGQQEAESLYHVNATPTFIINGKVNPGEMEYTDFAAAVANAAKG